MTDIKVDALDWLRNQLENEDNDMLRDMIREFAEYIMGAQIDQICCASYRERTKDRVNSRNGYRVRPWDTRAGTIDLSIPKLRRGSFYPSWLLEPRRRAEKALINVIVESYVLGVSTRRVDDLVQTMGLTGISKSQVSNMAKELDEIVEDFRTRPLTSAPFPYVWVDALVQKCRKGGRVVNMATLVAVGVNGEGRREILGVDVVTQEDGSSWLKFLRSLVTRGLSGVALVTSDAHVGLKNAIASVLPGAEWQRCRTHFMRNLLTQVPKRAQSVVAGKVRTIFSQPEREDVYEQHRRIVSELQTDHRNAALMLDDAKAELLAFANYPKEHWKQIWSNNPQERLNKEIRRRTDVVGIFPNQDSVIRLIGAVLAEQHDEWVVSKRYMSAESIAKVCTITVPTEDKEIKSKGAKKKLPKAA